MFLGAGCLLYFLAITIYAGSWVDFSQIWLAAAAFFFCFGKMFHNGLFRKLPAWLLITVGAVIGAGLLVFFFFLAQVISGMRPYEGSAPQYAVVLGAQVRGKTPSRSLRFRLERSEEYAQKYPDMTLVLTGGQGKGEDISEADCMSAWLEEHGIAKERMIREDQSVNTRQNLENAARLSGCAGGKCGIISNDFHIARALRIAGELGYEDPAGIPARSDALLWLHFTIREVFALAAEVIR